MDLPSKMTYMPMSENGLNKKVEPSNPALFITITLHPDNYVYKSSVQLKMSLDRIKKILSKSNYYGSCELTKASNMHYHIIVVNYNAVKCPITHWRNKFKCKKSEKPLFGFTKVEIVRNTQNTLTYINKDIISTADILDIKRATFMHLNEEQASTLGIEIPITSCIE